MTLTTQLAALNSELAGFNLTFEQHLAILAAIQANAVYHEFWVDPIGGDNTNDGLAAATSLQTLGAAVEKAPIGSYCLINLLSDYTMEADVTTNGRVVRVRGRTSLNVAAQRNLIQTVSGGAARRLQCQNGGGFQLARIDVRLTKSAITSGPTALVTGHNKSLYLLDCGVDVETGVTTAHLMGQDGTAHLEVDTVTALDDTLAGRWIGGVTAGSNPATLGKVLTNLATL